MIDSETNFGNRNSVIEHNSRRTSLVDVPKKHGEPDQLSLEKYENALSKLIMGAHTPLTIALQGEWGSGKTSLMNSLRYRLSDKDSKDCRFFDVWVNTWEFSLIGHPEEGILRILQSIILQIACTDPEDQTGGKKAIACIKRVWGGVAFAGRMATNVVAKSTMGVENFTGIGQMSPGDSENEVAPESEICKAKNLIRGMIQQSLEKHPLKIGFLFFIDDLDRIDPTVAVQILELLKNIFDLEKCIFILAIDYDVVIKGLKPKYGEKTAANEREFRSFFDKIIQLPFAMPVTKYDISAFLIKSLQAINFLTDNEAEDEELKVRLTRAAMWTIGNNPRSLKRLVNILSLIQMLDDDKSDEAEKTPIERFIEFSMVCIQISFPAIYNYLSVKPDFTKWDANFLKQLNLNDISAEDKDILCKISDKTFDEPWEQALFAMCQIDPYLKSNAWDLSSLLNAIHESIPQQESLEELVRSALGASSVTHVKSQNQIKEEETTTFHAGTELKKINAVILTKVNSLLEEAGKAKIRMANRRIRSSLTYLSEPQWWDMGKVSLRAEGSGVCLIVESGDFRLFRSPLTTPDFNKELSLRGVPKEQFQGFETQLKDLPQKHPKLKVKQVQVIEPHPKIVEGEPSFERWENYTFSELPLSSIISDEFMTEFAKFHFDLIQIRRDMNVACSAERAAEVPKTEEK